MAEQQNSPGFASGPTTRSWSQHSYAHRHGSAGLKEEKENSTINTRWLHENEATCVCTYGEVMLKVNIGFLWKILPKQEKDHKYLKKKKKKTEMFFTNLSPSWDI